MTQAAFGVWDGVAIDPRTASGETEVAQSAAVYALKGCDELDPGNPIKAFFGDRGFFVFDDSPSLVDARAHCMTKAAEQSCGACTAGRMGTVLMRDALDKMRRGLDGVGNGGLGFDEIEMLGEQMAETSLGGLGQTCGIALLGAAKNFRDKMEAEIADHRPIPAQHGMAYVTAPRTEACPSKVNLPRHIDHVRDGKPGNCLGVLL